jgi:hypothetical protein
MHWVCNDVKGLSAEVRKWNDSWYCDVVDMETGEVLNSWNMSHPLDAMHAAKEFINGIKS